MPLVKTKTTEAEREKVLSLLGLDLPENLPEKMKQKLLEEEWKYPHEFELFERPNFTHQNERQVGRKY